MKNKPNSTIYIDDRKIGLDSPAYFIADIAANHDGDLQRAKDLIYLAAEAGADAAKFQHFKAATIVSDYGFKNLGNKMSHQASWKKSVYEVYNDASVNLEWTESLKDTCEKAGITFFTSPYSFDLVDHVNEYVSAFKVGSGDITWPDIIRYMGSKKKPLLLATGASSIEDVTRAVDAALSETPNVVLMQCNTNYTADKGNFKYINLNVLKKYSKMYPDMILGLSDHTHGHVTVLGAIALGARVIEKHFTDDHNREGPDHVFSMNPKEWREMVDRSMELWLACGNEEKRVEANEEGTVVLQRRSIRIKQNLDAGTVLNKDHLIVLRPCPKDGIPPYELGNIIGKKVKRNLVAGEHLKCCDLI